MCLKDLSLDEVHESTLVVLRWDAGDLVLSPEQELRLETSLTLLDVTVGLKEVNQPNVVNAVAVV